VGWIRGNGHSINDGEGIHAKLEDDGLLADVLKKNYIMYLSLIFIAIMLFVIGILILLFANTKKDAIWDIIGFVLIIIGFAIAVLN
jgi:membrane-bound ClpP family serine protease